MKSFKQHLAEKSEKTVNFTFGRLNPPTSGHAKLVSKLTSLQGDSIIFLSQSQDKKKNPLSWSDKVKFVKKMFKGVKVSTNKNVKTPFHAIKELAKKYDNINMIVGSDRVQSFEKMVLPYINNPDSKDPIILNGEFKVISAGERDPDADGVSGMSASKMREFAKADDIESFSKGIDDLKDIEIKALFDLVKSNLA